MDEIVGGGKWLLRGTEAQNAILRTPFLPGAPSFIAFPWERITALPVFPVVISWDDLNDGTLGARPVARVRTWADMGERRPLNPHLLIRAYEPMHHEPMHHGGGHDDEGEEEGHAITRPSEFFAEPTGRMMIAGVFWSDGRIKIDVRLETQPAVAKEVLSAEIAHAVDYGLPMSNAQKAEFMTLLHPGGADTHTWWEQQDYGTEYFTLVGEAWMALFTHAYSAMEPWQDAFFHKSTRSMAAEVHRILGIPPVGTAPPPEPIPAFTLRLGKVRRTRLGNAYVELLWSGATGPRVIISRDGVRLMATANDGRFTNFLGTRHGNVRYALIDQRSTPPRPLSNELTVELP